jgi:hypothetical protein
MSGILIDTLAYKFINDWAYKDKSYLYYDYMSRDFFEYLKDIEKTQLYWLAPGSNRYVWKDGNFQNKASTAYNRSLEAIEHETNGRPYSSKQKWRKFMELNSPASQGYKLESQIREAYGRVVYTLTCHNKIVQRLLSKNNTI